MTQRLTISQILVYYDFPEIFIATNQVETTFLCLLVSTEQERTAYISTPISKRRLSDFIKGTIDLRDIFEKPEVEQWYFFDEVDEVIVVDTYAAGVRVLCTCMVRLWPLIRWIHLNL